jgi:asparaginyl-tRNA synthetase
VRQFEHLRPRTNFMGSVLRVRSAAASAMRQFFEVGCCILVVIVVICVQQQEYIEVQTPIITGNDCEGGSDAFCVVAPVCMCAYGRLGR